MGAISGLSIVTHSIRRLENPTLSWYSACFWPTRYRQPCTCRSGTAPACAWGGQQQELARPQPGKDTRAKRISGRSVLHARTSANSRNEEAGRRDWIAHAVDHIKFSLGIEILEADAIASIMSLFAPVLSCGLCVRRPFVRDDGQTKRTMCTYLDTSFRWAHPRTLG
jgi:hypothetical protein